MYGIRGLVGSKIYFGYFEPFLAPTLDGDIKLESSYLGRYVQVSKIF